MPIRLNGIWLVLLLLAGSLTVLYLWFTLFPGQPRAEIGQFFDEQQISQGRAYALGIRLTFIGAFLAQIIFLLWFVFGGKAEALSKWLEQFFGNSILCYLFFFLFLWLFLRLLSLPFDLFGDYFWQHRWEFATQTMGGWWLDYLKNAVLSIALSVAGVALLFWFMGRWPTVWWLMAASCVSLFMILQSFIWPVLIAPLFNRFEPVNDPAIKAMVEELAEGANLKVEQVLVMDASQRTTKANAYFTGLGSVKRIVLYDNLLTDYTPEEVKAVIAHEMAHWRQGHIIWNLLLGILANFLFWGLLFVLLSVTVPGMLTYGRYPPFSLAIIFLCVVLISFIFYPLTNCLSRHWESEADRIAVQLTGDALTAEQLHLDLAKKNLSDPAPPAFIAWFSYSHPPVVERIKEIRQSAP